ncbi:MAG: hypothetical protein RIR45_2038 [Pseudomonadota bacterium]
MQNQPFQQAISEHVWHTKYQWCEGGHMQEPSIEATWDRVALAVSSVEIHHRNDWRGSFRAMLGDFKFLPGGRILANVGTTRRATLFNCFAAAPPEDSISGIFNTLRETMQTLQSGGGTGIDFSTLRPANTPALASGTVATGPVSFMQVWEASAGVMEAGNPHRGAMMACLRCDHPDIESFIDAKLVAGTFTHFKLSVLVGDDFMRAVENDAPWPLVFPLGGHLVPAGAEVCERVWPGSPAPQLCLVHRRVPARALWEKLLAAEHACAEPAIFFIDRINRDNNLWYCETISTTNPGGAVPLPPHGACNLGSINLPRFVHNPFAAHPHVDFAAIKAVAALATRFLDNVHTLSPLPLKGQEKTVQASRRIGLGIAGLADMFVMLGLRYGSPASLELTSRIMGLVRDTAYSTSIEIAKEKGAFPAFDKIKYGASPFVLGLSHSIQDDIAQYGIRNSHLLAVAPASSVGLLANNVSSGIEPIFALKGARRVRAADGQWVDFEIEDAAVQQFRHLHGDATPLPAHFAQAMNVSTEDQLRMASRVQMCVDNAVSKTVRLPQSASTHDLDLALLQAWELGLKGCAVYRSGSKNSVTRSFNSGPV